jgi:hypothetical protein
MAIAITLFAGTFAFTEGSAEKTYDCAGNVAKQGKAVQEFCSLGSKLQHDVASAYTVARDEYVKGHYATCLHQFDIVHSFVQEYKNSRELVSFCEKGKQVEAREASNSK